MRLQLYQDNVCDWHLKQKYYVKLYWKVPYFIGWEDSFNENESFPFAQDRITLKIWHGMNRKRDQRA